MPNGGETGRRLDMVDDYSAEVRRVFAAEPIVIQPGAEANATRVQEILNEADVLKQPYDLVVLISGGADKIDEQTRKTISRVVSKSLFALADEDNIAVVYGGTKSGIMAAAGQGMRDIHANGRSADTVVGVYPDQSVVKEGQVEAEVSPENGALVDPYASVRIPVRIPEDQVGNYPYGTWGVETPTLLEVGRQLSEKNPSVVLLGNGGGITAEEFFGYLNQGQPIVVLDGSDRFARVLKGLVAEGKDAAAIQRDIEQEKQAFSQRYAALMTEESIRDMVDGKSAILDKISAEVPKLYAKALKGFGIQNPRDLSEEIKAQITFFDMNQANAEEILPTVLKKVARNPNQE